MKLAGGILLFLALGTGSFFGGYFISSLIVPGADERPVFTNYVPEPEPQAPVIEEVKAPAAPEAAAAPLAAATTTAPKALEKEEEPVLSPADKAAELAFADKLAACEIYKMSFTHFLTGEKLEKEVLGLIGDRCGYTEQLSSKMKMECTLSESERKAVAAFHKSSVTAKTFGGSISVNSSGTTVTQTIDGKVVTSPWQELMVSEYCAIL